MISQVSLSLMIETYKAFLKSDAACHDVPGLFSISYEKPFAEKCVELLHRCNKFKVSRYDVDRYWHEHVCIEIDKCVEKKLKNIFSHDVVYVADDVRSKGRFVTLHERKACANQCVPCVSKYDNIQRMRSVCFSCEHGSIFVCAIRDLMTKDKTWYCVHAESRSLQSLDIVIQILDGIIDQEPTSQIF